MNELLIKTNVAAAKKAAQDHGAVLCAVIKTRTNEEVDFAIRECGVDVVGENRVQELLSHYETVSSAGAKIHFIGHLQTNKVKYIADKVEMIESLDGIPLAEEIEKRMARLDKTMDVLIEVNIGEEPQKSGVFPAEALSFAKNVSRFPHLRVRGLMTVAPKCDDVSGYDEYFSHMVRLFCEFKKTYSLPEPPVLSMGMSGNFEKALEFGSTEIRVGTGIFGPRP